ncbi:Transcriptional regulator [Dimargaris xerosporica]|nr:Transcriptional regulator [Dimargaris xerosporica]
MARSSSLPPMGIAPHVEIVGLEERLKRELRYIGILGKEDVDWANREDDQVSAVLRHAQRQLQEQCEINQKRKDRLYDIAREHMAYQEYQHIVDELDKQVEQSYVKRNRGQKKKGKKTVAVKTVLSDTAVHALERRKRIIDGIGGIFPREKFLPPATSVYADLFDPGQSLDSPNHPPGASTTLLS